MIKNIIFDIGNVLAAFDWEGALNRFNFSEEEYEAIADAVFRSSDWNEMDRGVMTVEEVTTRFCRKIPQYAEDVKRVVGSYSHMIRQYPYTKDLIRELKARGLNVYYLSNYGRYGYEQTEKELDFIELMDGGLFSYEIKIVKPCKWIYMELMERYGMDPKETVFFDDNASNAEGAGVLGITGIQFVGYEQAITSLKELGVL